MPEFSEDFERDILAAFRRNPDVYADYREVVEPEIFRNPVYRKLAVIFEDFFLEHGELPTLTTMVDLITEYDKDGWWIEEEKEILFGSIDPIMNGHPVNEQYVLDRMINYAKKRKIEQKLSEAAEQYAMGKAVDIDDIVSIVRDAELKSLMSKEKENEDFISNMDKYLERLKNMGGDESLYQPTFVDPLDSALGGGPKLGNKVIIFGPPGGGKTTVCTHIAGSSVISGSNVMYLYNDDTDEEMTDRFMSFFSGIPSKYFLKGENPDKIRERQKTLESGRGRLYKRYIPFGTKPATVKRLVEQKEEEGNCLDVLIIDHIGNLGSRRQTDDFWRDIGETCKELYSICLEHNLVLYIVAHTKRQAEGRTSMRQDLLGLSYEPVKDINLMIAIWRLIDLDDRESNGEFDAFRMHVVKRRGGPGLGAKFRFKADFPVSQFDLVEQTEDESTVLKEEKHELNP